jgi:DNA-binding winged helix-turn-helix (wHTH) protein/WD40 repeat protein
MRAAFGPFSFDLCALELSKNGMRLRLEEKPARLLACLIERKGEMVTREELCKRLWPDHVNLDFDHGLNKAMNKLRGALSDTAADSKYLETLSKRGYRFVHAVELFPADETAFESKKSPPVNIPNAPGVETKTPELRDSLLEVPAPVSIGSRGRFRSGLMITVSLAVIMALVPAAARLKNLLPPPLAPRHIHVPPELKLITQGDGTLAISPDGSRTVFAAVGADRRPRLWILDLSSSQTTALPGTDGGTQPFWSPDGNHIGFFTLVELKTIDLSNYSIKVLAPVESARGGSWSSKGVILFASETRGPILRIPADGGVAVPVTALESISSTTNRWPALLPDENHFVYFEASHNAPEAPGRIMLGSLDGRDAKFLLESDSNAAPGRDNLAFVFRGKLLSVHLSKRTFEPDSQPQILAEGIDCDRGSWYCAFAMNKAGVLYRPRNGATDLETISRFDSSGNKLTDLGPPGVYRSVDLSPDGKIVAVTCGDPDQKICLIHEDGSLTRLESHGIVSKSVWAPDSSAIAYLDHRSHSEFEFSIKPLRGSLPAHTILASQIDLSPIAWHPNGRYVLFSRARPSGNYDLGVLDLKTGETIPYLSETSAEADMAAFSPNGRWVAFSRQTGDLKQIYVASFPVPSVMFPLTSEGGCAAKWRDDGNAIYYLGPGDTLYSVSLVSSSVGFRIGKTTALFRPPIFFAPWNCISFDVDRDGTGFVINTVPSPTEQELISAAY